MTQSRAADSTSTAVLFDIDGTLVDSNYLHIEAWARALADLQLHRDVWRIHRCIGMDSAKLLDTLLGDQPEQVHDRAKKLHAQYYAEMRPRLRVFAGARELLADLASRGITVVLATSAPEQELRSLREVLKVEDQVAAVTSGDDVEVAKPAPGIVRVALERARATPDSAIMVGDSTWDVAAAARAKVACIGVLSGGISRQELLDAGAVAVYTDVAELWDQLENSPLSVLTALGNRG